MSQKPHKPVRMPSWRLELSESDEDLHWRKSPEVQLAIAHDTARALVRDTGGPQRAEILRRLNAFVDEEGIDTLAELWSHASRGSLPRALYLLYRIRSQVLAHPEAIAQAIARGMDTLPTIDPIVLAPRIPVDADGVGEVVEQILSGSFGGSLELALSRAGALCRVVSAGLLSFEGADDESHKVALQSLSWGLVADELALSASRETKGILQ